jgi:6-phosphofructokinase
LQVFLTSRKCVVEFSLGVKSLSEAKNAMVAQSGGPTCAINSSLSGVVSQASKYVEIDCMYGALYGIEGVLHNRVVNLSDSLKNPEDFRRLESTPSACLGTSRHRLPDPSEDIQVYERIFETFEKLNIGYFFYIGGNDSMDTVLKLSRYAAGIDSDIRFIGVPKTIDNDLDMTDHSPGYGSTAKFIAATFVEMTCDCESYAIPSVTIVEIMGRNAGWLTAASALARQEVTAPHLIYLPEMVFDCDRFLNDVKKQLLVRNTVIIAVSEGLCDSDGKYMSEYYHPSQKDDFGHTALSGVSSYLSNLVKSEIKCKVRPVELNIMQRCAAHFASATDIRESVRIGRAAVKAAIGGETGKFMAFVRNGSDKYSVKIKSVPLENVANKEKKLPVEWITKDGNDVTEAFFSYIRPLIKGEAYNVMSEGIPKRFVIDKESQSR